MLFSAEGVRQTLLLNLLERRAEDASLAPSTSRGGASVLQDGHLTLSSNVDSSHEVSASNDAFLESRLSFVDDPSTGTKRCLDVDGGLVMAPWETDIMALSASLLCDDAKPDCAVLNVGFGLGIIDELFQARNPPPARHVIIEAHPDAIAHAKQLGWDKRPGVELIHAKWEDALESLEGDFDAVYWDTYAQGYGELRSFFEHLPNLLSGPEAKFSFCESDDSCDFFFLANIRLKIRSAYVPQSTGWQAPTRSCTTSTLVLPSWTSKTLAS